MKIKERMRLGMGAVAMAGLSAFAIAGMGSAIPQQMVGEWRCGTINPTTFHDSSTGAYLGHGGGMSMYFVFKPDGTYHKYFYVEQSPSAGWTTRAWSESEGRLIVSGDTFTLKATKGHYIGKDNRVARYNIDRDMTETDLQNEAKAKYRWTMGKDAKGATIMMIAPGGTGQGSQFQKIK